MSEALPQFKYHPDPVRNETVIASECTCVCCRHARGNLYVGPAFTTNRDVTDNVCPWCIVNGSAAQKYDVQFSDAHPLLTNGIARDIVDEVTKRTPGYFSWQQDHWQSHCNDACVFHGDATAADIATAAPATIAAWKMAYSMKDEDWARLAEGYEPKGHSAFYKFVCSYRGIVLLSWDLDCAEGLHIYSTRRIGHARSRRRVFGICEGTCH
jgi:uncharacterized protein